MNDMTTRLTTSLVTAVAGLFGTTGAVYGQPVSIFFPPEYENVEAPGTDTEGIRDLAQWGSNSMGDSS